MEQYRGTTIVSVRRNNKVAIAGDGQVSLGNTVMKGNARKVRTLASGKVIAGFAGGRPARIILNKGNIRAKIRVLEIENLN